MTKTDSQTTKIDSHSVKWESICMKWEFIIVLFFAIFRKSSKFAHELYYNLKTTMKNGKTRGVVRLKNQ